MPGEGQTFIWLIFSGLLIASLGGLLALGFYWHGRTRGQRPFYPVPAPFPLWNGVTVLISFAILMVAVQFTQVILLTTGFYEQLYGDELIGREKENLYRLWASVLSFPLQLWAFYVLAKQSSIKQPFPIGQSRMQYIAAYVHWLFVIPISFSIFQLANAFHRMLTGQGPDMHPLTAVLDSGLREQILFILQTVVVAPVLEEIVFRGIILIWLAQRVNASSSEGITLEHSQRLLFVSVAAVVISFAANGSAIELSIREQNQKMILSALAPGLFCLVLTPLVFTIHRWQRLLRFARVRSPRHARAIIATSLLFASAHSTVWPSPVPLFVLSISLGYLQMRSRSVLGPIIVHSMFNAVSTLFVVLARSV